MPVCSAAPCPRLIGCRTTTAPASNAMSPVRSLEPSSTTTTAYPARRIPDTTLPTIGASLYAATTTQGLRIRPVMFHQPTSRTRPQPITAIPTWRCAESGSTNTSAAEHGRQRKRDRHEWIRARQQCGLAEVEALGHGRLLSGHGGALLKTTRIASNRFTGMANRLPVGLAAILRPSMRPTWKAISENGTNFQG